MPTEFPSPIAKKLILLTVLAVAVAVILMMPAFAQTADAAGDYIDENGDPYVPVGEMPLATATMPLTGGCYYVDSNLTYGAVTINGDVILLIADGCTLTVSTVTVNNGILKIYTQSDGTGTITGSNTITLNGTSSLVNVAVIESTNGFAVRSMAGSTVSITNCAGAKITGNTLGVYLVASGTVDNSGKITGSSNQGINIEGSAGTVINHVGAEITGSKGGYGVYLSGGGTVDNSGKITGTGSTGVVIKGSAGTVTNRADAEITGTNCGVDFGAGGTVDNSGKITGSAGTGIYSSGTVTNNAGGEIAGGGIGVRSYSGTVDNSGKITGNSEYGIAFSGTGTLTNNADAEITGGMHGVYLLEAGGTVDNSGTITGGTRGIYATSATLPVTFTNRTDASVIGDVLLANVVNTVTFEVGSMIAGDFALGTNDDSTLAFTAPLGSVIGDFNTTADGEPIYSTVTGKTTIPADGSSTKVSFTNPPVGYNGIIVLIDGGEVVPYDSTFGKYTIKTRGYPPGTTTHNQLIAGNFITLIIIGNGDIKVEGTGFTTSTYSGPSGPGEYKMFVPFDVTELTFTATPDAGYDLISIEQSGSASVTVAYGPVSFTIAADDTITVMFDSATPQPPQPKTYYIDASADTGSTISPSGKVPVQGGESKTFTFSAKSGYHIIAVLVDGVPQPQSVIDSGSYTFHNVNMNHTIEVKSTAGPDPRDPGKDDPNKGDPNNPDPQPKTTGDKDNGWIWWAVLLIIILAVLILLLLLLWYRGGLFLTVTKDKDGVKGATVTYAIVKDGKTENGTIATNSKGKCRIKAKKDSVVTISTVTKENGIAIGLPLVVNMENRREHRTIMFR